MFYYYFYLFASLFLSLVFFISSVSKFVQGEGLYKRAFMGIIPGWAVLLVELILSFLFLIYKFSVVHCFASFLLIVVTSVGVYNRFKYPNMQCECLGSLTPSSKWGYLLLNFVTWVLCFYVIYYNVVGARSDESGSISVLAIAIVLMLILSRKLSYDREVGVGYSEKFHVPSTGDVIPFFSLVKNFDINKNLDLSNKKILILAVSSRCGVCKQSVDEVFSFVERFENELLVFIVSESKLNYSKNYSEKITFFIDSGSDFGRFIGVRARPILVFLDENYRILIPLIRGSSNISKLLSMWSGR